jgi:hypothetical protein
MAGDQSQAPGAADSQEEQNTRVILDTDFKLG